MVEDDEVSCDQSLLFQGDVYGTTLRIELFDITYNRQNEASGTKGTKRTKLKLLRRNEAYA